MKELNFSRYLDTNGNGTGTKDAVGNYSGAEEIFYLKPADGEFMQVNRLIITVRDTGAMDAANYGSTSPLTTGVVVREHSDDSGVIVDWTDGVPIKKNADWGSHCYDADVKTWGAGDEFLLVRWTFGASGLPMLLDGSRGDKLEVVLNDDFTGTGAGLNEHRFLAQGVHITP